MKARLEVSQIGLFFPVLVDASIVIAKLPVQKVELRHALRDGHSPQYLSFRITSLIPLFSGICQTLHAIEVRDLHPSSLFSRSRRLLVRPRVMRTEQKRPLWASGS
ncbi:MAG: hypothetical protein FJX76_23165 [Armatimonadetes bacterium]|nr:hypothetical protein [Armatimonadota bacterium]